MRIRSHKINKAKISSISVNDCKTHSLINLLVNLTENTMQMRSKERQPLTVNGNVGLRCGYLHANYKKKLLHTF